MGKRVQDKDVSSLSDWDGNESMMFDPGGVLHAALRAALRRSQECFARGVVPRRARDDKSPTVPSLPFPLRCKGASRGDLGGRKEKAIHHLCNDLPWGDPDNDVIWKDGGES